MPASLQSVPTVAKLIVLPSAAVTEPVPVMNSHAPPTPFVPTVPGIERLKEYVAFPTCWGIAGPLEDTPVKLADPLPVPWTSQFSPAAGAAIALAAKPRPSASASSSRARIGLAQRDVISVLPFPLEVLHVIGPASRGSAGQPS